MENIKRLDYLDVSKGVGILLVVLGHIYTMRPGINRSIPTVWIYYRIDIIYYINCYTYTYNTINK